MGCYYCGEKSTSREHVPPKCLFPDKAKDESPQKLNLITVPSCDKHNLKKSGDDEYLKRILVASSEDVSSGGVLYGEVIRAAIRDIRASKERLADYGLSESDGVIAQHSSYVEIDLERIAKSFDSMARALFFKHYRKICTSTRYNVFPHFLDYDEKLNSEQRLQIEKNNQTILDAANEHPWQGTNAHVFKYKIGIFHPDMSAVLVHMIFYKSKLVSVLLANDE